MNYLYRFVLMVINDYMEDRENEMSTVRVIGTILDWGSIYECIEEGHELPENYKRYLKELLQYSAIDKLKWIESHNDIRMDNIFDIIEDLQRYRDAWIEYCDGIDIHLR